MPGSPGRSASALRLSWCCFRGCCSGHRRSRKPGRTSRPCLPVNGREPALLAGRLYAGNVGLMALCALVAFQRVQAFDWVQRMSWPRLLLVLAVFVYSLLTMFVQAFNPFLYFQF